MPRCTRRRQCWTRSEAADAGEGGRRVSVERASRAGRRGASSLARRVAAPADRWNIDSSPREKRTRRGTNRVEPRGVVRSSRTVRANPTDFRATLCVDSSSRRGARRSGLIIELRIVCAHSAHRFTVVRCRRLCRRSSPPSPLSSPPSFPSDVPDGDFADSVQPSAAARPRSPNVASSAARNPSYGPRYVHLGSVPADPPIWICARSRICAHCLFAASAARASHRRSPLGKLGGGARVSQNGEHRGTACNLA